jgi:putative salt-induced outer membrane protein
VPLLVATPAAASLPYNLSSMLDAALASNNEVDIVTVAKYIRLAAPTDAAEVDERVTAWRDQRTKAQKQQVIDAGPLELWKGRADIGGALSTGNTDSLGITAGIDVKREGLDWRHRVRLRADYQRDSGVRTREAFTAAWEPSYKINERLSVAGLSQFERDPFLGYSERFTGAVGVGYRAVSTKLLTLDVNAGPAFRFTNFIDGSQQDSPAGRASTSVALALSPTLKFTNDSAAYFDSINNTVISTSAIDAKLIGPLSARVSYNVQYEGHPPEGRKTVDTQTRASLVYNF